MNRCQMDVQAWSGGHSGISKAISIVSRGSQKTPRRWRRWPSIALCMASAECGCTGSNAAVIASLMVK